MDKVTLFLLVILTEITMTTGFVTIVMEQSVLSTIHTSLLVSNEVFIPQFKNVNQLQKFCNFEPEQNS